MIYEIVITGDTNDADYVTRIEDITPEQIERFKPLIAAIKKKKGHPWPVSEYADGSPEELYPKFAGEYDEENGCPTGLISEFMEFVPWDIHSIESIVYYEKPIKTVLI